MFLFLIIISKFIAFNFSKFNYSCSHLLRFSESRIKFLIIFFQDIDCRMKWKLFRFLSKYEHIRHCGIDSPFMNEQIRNSSSSIIICNSFHVERISGNPFQFQIRKLRQWYKNYPCNRRKAINVLIWRQIELKARLTSSVNEGKVFMKLRRFIFYFFLLVFSSASIMSFRSKEWLMPFHHLLGQRQTLIRKLNITSQVDRRLEGSLEKLLSLLS